MTNVYDVTEDVVSSLSIPATRQTIYKNTGMFYDCAINGNPFLFSTNDNNPYLRSFAQMKKDQIDQSPNPGEQSLTMWWTRNQSDFSGGAGIKYYEPVSDERVMRSFVSSIGINPWKIGQISLLNKVNTTDISMVDFTVATIGGIERIVTITSTTVTVRDASNPATVISTISGQTGLLGIIAVNDRFVVWNNSTIYISDVNGSALITIATKTNTSGTSYSIQKVWFAKQRLIVAQTNSTGASNYPAGSSIAEVALAFSTPATTAIGVTGASSTLVYTHPNPSWTWTAVVDSPQAILAAGYAGNNSSIFKFTLNTTDASKVGSLVTLSAPVTAAELPTGERVTAMGFYLGAYVGIGTNLGFRVGVVDDYGNLTYGQLLFTTANPVSAVACYDTFFWVAVSNGVNGQHGTYRVNLADQDNNTYMRLVLSMYSYATDVYINGTNGTSGSVVDMAILSTGKVVLGTAVTLGIESSQKLTSGTVTFGQIRYNTYENKLFKKVSIKGNFPSGTKVDINSVQVDGTVYGIFTARGEDTIDVAPRIPLSSLGFQLVLYSDTSYAFTPVITGVQVKSLPAVARQQNIQVSLLCFDYEGDMHGNKKGGSGTSLQRFIQIVNDTKIGDTILYQDFHTGENTLCIVEELQFNQTSPPRPNTSGFGGIITLVLKTIV